MTFQDQPGPGQPRVRGEVHAQQGVGRDHRAGAGGDLLDGLAAAGGGPGDRHHGQVRREPGRFGGPVGHHAGRGDDQERRKIRVSLPGLADERQGLERLAQAHVVGEDAAELVLPQEGQPAEAVPLVGPQLRVQGVGQFRSRPGLR